MTPGAGQLRIRLLREAGALRSEVAAPQALPVAALVRGRSAEQAARLVPLLFNVCAAAQETAVRSAFGLPVSAELARRVAAETLREHAVKLLLVWPPLLGERPARAAAGHAAHALDEPFAGRSLARGLFAPLETAPESWADLESWMAAGATAPARSFRAVAERWDLDWGRVDGPLLDVAAPPDWPAPLQAGLAVENGPACRMADSSLLREIAARRGHGLLWRMAARLVEAARLLGQAAPEALAAPGVANAARGAMYVRAGLGGAGVERFERLSPTDFALVPGGLLAAALDTLPDAADAPLEPVARMLVETVDPCVPTHLEVGHA